jgi:predicted nuclease with RNAse H fold
MCTAAASDRVLLCVRAPGVLVCHGEATVAEVPKPLAATPEDVRDLYGDHRDRWFVQLAEITLAEPRDVNELSPVERQQFLRGQSFVKRLSRRGVSSRSAPLGDDRGLSAPHASKIATTARDSLFPVTAITIGVEGAAPVVVIGLDPTAGTWESGMQRGPKSMTSVTLDLSQGRLRARQSLVHRHDNNAAFLDHVREVNASVVCIDGPCATNGFGMLPGWSGWDLSKQGAPREAERELAREGVSLYWTTLRTLEAFDGASRWIARSLRLFDQASGIRASAFVETHPHAVFTLLWRDLRSSMPLKPKTSFEGRKQRLAVLQKFIHDLDDADLQNHDEVDAAAAALMAGLYAASKARSRGAENCGGLIWVPMPELVG